MMIEMLSPIMKRLVLTRMSISSLEAGKSIVFLNLGYLVKEISDGRIEKAA